MFPHLLMVNGEIYSLPKETFHLARSSCIFQHYMILSLVHSYLKTLTTLVMTENCVPLVMFLANFPIIEL